MTEDTGSPTDSITNQIASLADRTGLPDTIKGRAQRFILRWIAGSVGHPYVRQIRDNLDEIEGRSKVQMMLAEEVGRQAIADPAMVERAKLRLLGDVLQKQENVEAIARAAQHKIEEDIEIDSVGKEQTRDPTSDWMNSFTREAEIATSDELRDRLARILAGEIKKPGTFARSTIRTISELDQEILSVFADAAKDQISGRIVRGQDWQSGLGFERGVMLEDAGLISGSGGMIHTTIKADENGNGFFLGNKYALVIQSSPGIEKQLGVWLLTRIGRELSSLLPESDELEGLRRAAVVIDKSQVKKIIIGRRVIESENLISMLLDEVAWSSPDADGSGPKNL